MKVSELIEALQAMEPDMEVHSRDDDTSIHWPVLRVERQTVRTYDIASKVFVDVEAVVIS